MKRAVVVSPEFPPFAHASGGLATHVAALVAGLSARGWSIDVLIPTTEPLERHHTFEACGARIHRIAPSAATRAFDPTSLKYKTAYHGRDLLEGAIEIVRRTDGPVSLVHTHDWHLGRMTVGLRAALGAPLLVTVHLLFAAALPAWGEPVPPSVERIERDTCTSADTVIVVSERMVKAIGDVYGVPPERVRVVNNTLASDAHERLLTVPTGDRTEPEIVFLGRITRQKGLLGLLESARLVANERPDARWRLLGPVADPTPTPTTYGEEVRAALSRLRLEGHVDMPGPVAYASLGDVYARAAFVVLPSLHESFPYAALESMTAGVALVATDVGGVPEIMEDGRTGILVPTRRGEGGACVVDPRALADAQLRLLRDPALARKMGDAARARMKAVFPPSRMIDETERVYLELAQRHS